MILLHRPGLILGDTVTELSSLIETEVVGSQNNGGQEVALICQSKTECYSCNEKQGWNESHGEQTLQPMSMLNRTQHPLGQGRWEPWT